MDVNRCCFDWPERRRASERSSRCVIARDRLRSTAARSRPTHAPASRRHAAAATQRRAARPYAVRVTAVAPVSIWISDAATRSPRTPRVHGPRAAGSVRIVAGTTPCAPPALRRWQSRALLRTCTPPKTAPNEHAPSHAMRSASPSTHCHVSQHSARDCPRTQHLRIARAAPHATPPRAQSPATPCVAMLPPQWHAICVTGCALDPDPHPCRPGHELAAVRPQ